MVNFTLINQPFVASTLGAKAGEIADILYSILASSYPDLEISKTPNDNPLPLSDLVVYSQADVSARFYAGVKFTFQGLVVRIRVYSSGGYLYLNANVFNPLTVSSIDSDGTAAMSTQMVFSILYSDETLILLESVPNTISRVLFIDVIDTVSQTDSGLYIETKTSNAVYEDNGFITGGVWLLTGSFLSNTYNKYNGTYDSIKIPVYVTKRGIKGELKNTIQVVGLADPNSHGLSVTLSGIDYRVCKAGLQAFSIYLLVK